MLTGIKKQGAFMIETKTVVIPYTHATINRLESKLSEICKEGWALVSVKFWSFTFTKAKPDSRKYFVYSNPDRNKGVDFDYYTAKNIYRNKKSKLKNQPSIFEVDKSKLDSVFNDYLNLRNKYYTKFYLSMVTLFLILIVLSCISIWQLSIPLAIPMIYYIVSLFIIVFDSKKYNK